MGDAPIDDARRARDSCARGGIHSRAEARVMRVRGWKRDGGARGGWDRCARGTRGGEGGGWECVGRRDGGTAARAGEFSAGRGREAEEGGERLVY